MGITISPVPLVDHHVVKKILKPRGAIITPFTIISVAEYFACCSIDRAYIN